MSNIIILGQKIKPKKPNIGIIIQARMTSVRFPGKSMSDLLGKPVLQWILERARHIRAPKGLKTKIVLAVPDTDDSEPMLILADKLRVDNYCGPEHNVLRRYYEAAMFFEFDYVVRLTADCPFIDPVVCSEVLQLLIWRKLDYTSNVFPNRTYPVGLDCEAFTMDCLEAAYKLADQLYDLEHVTPWMQRTEEIRKGSVEQKENTSYKNWCVDYPEDIERLTKEINENQIVKIGEYANDNAD